MPLRTLVAKDGWNPGFTAVLERCGPFDRADAITTQQARNMPPALWIPGSLKAYWVARGGYIAGSQLHAGEVPWPVDAVGFHVFEEVAFDEWDLHWSGSHLPTDEAKVELERISWTVWPLAIRALDVAVMTRLVLLLRQVDVPAGEGIINLRWRQGPGPVGEHDVFFDSILKWDELDEAQRDQLPLDTVVAFRPGIVRSRMFGPLATKEWVDTSSGFENYWHMMGRVHLAMICTAQTDLVPSEPSALTAQPREETHAT